MTDNHHPVPPLQSVIVEPPFVPADWYDACKEAAARIASDVPEYYRARTFSGILGDIKALPARKALSLISRKKGLGLQYAGLYLSQGIDGGQGYQACAAEALSSVLSMNADSMTHGRILDAGCAVGVTAGVLGLDGVNGFDLFPDLLHAASLVDSLTGASHQYITADMTDPWPFEEAFDCVVCGLVCHHLKEQSDVVRFFGEANRVLHTGGKLIITLPSGSVATPMHFERVVEALSGCGFTADRNLTGMAISADSEHSLFWAFIIVACKNSPPLSDVFIEPSFGFHHYRTPVTREEKGERARVTAFAGRSVRHESFVFHPLDTLLDSVRDTVLVFENVRTMNRCEF